MELGMVGLGRMGANMARRLMRDGHRIVAFDVSPDAVAALAEDGAEGASSLAALAETCAALAEEGAEGSSSLADLAEKLAAPRSVWVMVPAGEITEQTIGDLA